MSGGALDHTWLPPTPSGWKRGRVRNVCVVETGSKDTVDAVEGGDFPFFIRSPQPLTIDEYAYDTEAILTPGDGDVGRIFHHVRGKFNVHQRVYVFRDFREVLPRYFYYWVLSQFRNATEQGTAKSTVASLRRPMIVDFPILFPELYEQQAIADFLDRETAQIDAMLEAQEQLVSLLHERRHSELLAAITRGLDPDVDLAPSPAEWVGEAPSHWRFAQIKRLSPVHRGASPRPIENQIYFDTDGDHGWVRISDVTASRDGVLKETTQTLSALGVSLSVPLAPGQLFVSIAGSVGKACVAGIKCCIHDGFVYFPRLNINPRWLYRVFEAGACYAGLGKWGTQLNLNTDSIGSIPVPLPPTEEMEAILDHLDTEIARIDQLIDEAERIVRVFRERRGAVIAAAVTGRIDPKTGIERIAPPTEKEAS